MNHYANKKSAAESMLDIALLMANASQLKAVMEQGPSFSFYIPLIVLISISLILQIGVGVLLIFLVKYDLNNPAKHAKLDVLNNLATGLVFIIVVVNIFITAFGVQKPVAETASRQGNKSKQTSHTNKPQRLEEPLTESHRWALFPSSRLFPNEEPERSSWSWVIQSVIISLLKPGVPRSPP
ncbi:Ninjurin-1 [Chelonia mydas]|uniref:Ninjurin-1 n=1 Tax=Chelonia mydas TaxID=8469 RepID=M7B6V3_CHEMY|nr:Ninjurin-1 [Chelonia mydas]